MAGDIEYLSRKHDKWKRGSIENKVGRRSYEKIRQLNFRFDISIIISAKGKNGTALTRAARETERGTKPGVAADGAVGVLPGAAVGAVERVLWSVFISPSLSYSG